VENNIKMKCTGQKRGFSKLVYFILIYESKTMFLGEGYTLRTDPKMYEHKLMKLEMGLIVVPTPIFITDLLKTIIPRIRII
jgi:hypothetical protein